MRQGRELRTLSQFHRLQNKENNNGTIPKIQQIKFQSQWNRMTYFGLHKSLKRHPDIHYMSIKSYDIYLRGSVSRVPLANANTVPITSSTDRSKRI